MYTEEKLKSDEYIRLYKFVGRNSLKPMLKVENILAKRKTKRDLNIQLEKEAFITRDDTMHYISSIRLNSDGTYLRINVTKTIGNNLLDISLERGIDGFDYSTGERYDRKQAKVAYTYDNEKIVLKEIQDEIYFNNLEEQRKEEVHKKVLSNKK